MGKGVSPAFGTGSKEHGGSAEGFANADGLHLGPDVAEGVEDGVRIELTADGAFRGGLRASAIDVQVDRLGRVVVPEPEELRDGELRHLGHNGKAEVANAGLEEHGGDVRR